MEHLTYILYLDHKLSLIHIFNAESISYMPAFGFSTAASTMVGQNLGANQPHAAKITAVECVKMAAIIMGTMGLMFALFPVSFMKIFTDDARVFPYGYMTMRFLAYMQIPESVGFVMSGALRGAGDTKAVLAITIAGAWGIRVGLTPVSYTHLDVYKRQE